MFGTILDYILFQRFSAVDFFIVLVGYPLLQQEFNNIYLSTTLVALSMIAINVFTEKWFSDRYGDDENENDDE